MKKSFKIKPGSVGSTQLKNISRIKIRSLRKVFQLIRNPVNSYHVNSYRYQLTTITLILILDRNTSYLVTSYYSVFRRRCIAKKQNTWKQNLFQVKSENKLHADLVEYTVVPPQCHTHYDVNEKKPSLSLKRGRTKGKRGGKLRQWSK